MDDYSASPPKMLAVPLSPPPRPRAIYFNDSHPPSPPSPTSKPVPPSLPVRSPLRPPPTKNAAVTTSLASLTLADSKINSPHAKVRGRSGGYSATISDGEIQTLTLTTRDQPHQRRPSNASTTSSPYPTSPVATSSSPPPIATKTSKRAHALLELLSSERAYASDLALISQVHIPLAQGHPPPYQLPAPLPTPPNSNPSSSAASVSTRGSGSSDGFQNTVSSVKPLKVSVKGKSKATIPLSREDPNSQPDPPMSKEDARVIFGNVEAVAQFADVFAQRLEDALGSVLTGEQTQNHRNHHAFTQNDDYVGALFQEMIPGLGLLYTVYITHHSLALARLTSLMTPTPSPSFQKYITATAALASSHTSAWDLPSLLIKPVQRLLKYPLLLSSIIEATPSQHPDYQGLKRAKERIEELARAVNGRQGRWEVVKNVLETHYSIGLVGGIGGAFGLLKSSSTKSLPAAPGPSSAAGSSPPSQSSGLPGPSTTPSGDAANSNPHSLTRMRSLRTRLKPPIPILSTPALPPDLVAFQTSMAKSHKMLRDYARQILEWSKSLRDSLRALLKWIRRFGDVLDLQPRQKDDTEGEDAVRASADVVRSLLGYWEEFDSTLREVTHSRLTTLLKTLSQPTFLINHTLALYPTHCSHLSTPYKSKTRSPHLAQASKTYLALSAQIREELPVFMKLFKNGLDAVIMQGARLQARWFEVSRSRWNDFARSVSVELPSSSDGQSPSAIITLFLERFEGGRDPLDRLGLLNRGSRASGRFYNLPVPESEDETGGLEDEYAHGYSYSNRFGEDDAFELGDGYWLPLEELDGIFVDENGVNGRGPSPAPSSTLEPDPSRISTDGRVDSSVVSEVVVRQTKDSFSSESGQSFSIGRHGRSDSVTTTNSIATTNTSVTATTITTNRTSASGSGSSGSSTRALIPSSRSNPRNESLATIVPLKVQYPYDPVERNRIERDQYFLPSTIGGFGGGVMGLPPLSFGSGLKESKEEKKERKRKEKERVLATEVEKGRNRSLERQNSLKRRLTDSIFPSPSPSFPPSNSSPEGFNPIHSVPSTPPPYRVATALREADASTSQVKASSQSRSSPPSSFPTKSRPRLSVQPSIAFPKQSGSPSPTSAGSGDSPAVSSPSLLRRSRSLSTNQSNLPALYIVTCVHPFHPPRGAVHLKLPFLTLNVGDHCEVLSEAGPPSMHDAIPIYVDDGEDCLLVCRDERGRVGWTLASFVLPFGSRGL